VNVDHLVIEVRDSDAVDAATGLQRRMQVQYNPTQVSLSKSAQIAEIAIPGLDSPIQQFIRGQTEKLTLELLFDTSALGMGAAATSVRTLTDPVAALVRIQPKTHAPPRVRITWGTGLSFTAIAESVEVKFTLFAPDGTPLRAMATAVFRGYKTLREQLADLKLESADHTKRRVVKQGDTLSRIAGEELGDPARWRVLADANPGVDPIDPTPGTLLDVPPIDLFGGVTGVPQ
jgi:nucleoid-associated protein YgaU